MANSFLEMSDAKAWKLLVDASKRAMKEAGYGLKRVPGRGRSNVWEFAKDGNCQRGAIRTTKDRWFAFVPLEEGTKWKTLDDVSIVVIAAVDNVDEPCNVEVYQFDAEEVRERFDASYAARKQAGQTVRDDFGMWVNLDVDNKDLPTRVGGGIAVDFTPIAIYPLSELTADEGLEGDPVPDGNGNGTCAQESNSFPQPDTIAEVMAWARQRIGMLSGVGPDAVKIDCKIEY